MVYLLTMPKWMMVVMTRVIVLDPPVPHRPKMDPKRNAIKIIGGITTLPVPLKPSHSLYYSGIAEVWGTNTVNFPFSSNYTTPISFVFKKHVWEGGTTHLLSTITRHSGTIDSKESHCTFPIVYLMNPSPSILTCWQLLAKQNWGAPILPSAPFTARPASPSILVSSKRSVDNYRVEGCYWATSTLTIISGGARDATLEVTRWPLTFSTLT